MDQPSTIEARSSGAALALFVVGYSIAHHNGLIAELVGSRTAEGVDFATPFVVLLPLLWFLWSQRPTPRVWLVAAVGSIVYVEGHGIHLAANSIDGLARRQQASGQLLDRIYFWDEVAGHYIWYAGLAIVIAACAYAARGKRSSIPWWALALGGAVSGLTWATNSLEGGTAVFSGLVAMAAVAIGARRRTALWPALAAGGAVAVIVIAGYGLANGGFPQPSSL